MAVVTDPLRACLVELAAGCARAGGLLSVADLLDAGLVADADRALEELSYAGHSGHPRLAALAECVAAIVDQHPDDWRLVSAGANLWIADVVHPVTFVGLCSGGDVSGMRQALMVFESCSERVQRTALAFLSGEMSWDRALEAALLLEQVASIPTA